MFRRYCTGRPNKCETKTDQDTTTMGRGWFIKVQDTKTSMLKETGFM